MPAPFIYIGALRRSGSTVLSEALTALPYSFVFREPRLGFNHFALKDADRERFAKQGVDLDALRRRHGVKSLSFAQRLLHPDRMLRFFAEQVVPALQPLVQQIGVKEIRNDHWRRYHRFFPGMKIVLIARDPRDIYISVHDRKERAGTATVTPKYLAKVLNQQFRFQREMMQAAACLCVTYEEFCTDRTVFDRVRKFTESPLPALGDVGALNASNPDRAWEAALHGGAITAQRVNRWRQEPDAKLVAEAHELFERMPAYCEFWKYRR